jgi:hypothetical protein
LPIACSIRTRSTSTTASSSRVRIRIDRSAANGRTTDAAASTRSSIATGRRTRGPPDDSASENLEVAFKTGVDITPLAMDTVQVHLTKPEMARLTHAEGHGGVVAVVSDGTREGYAEFSSAEAG